jgi:hypothetical protein
MLRNWCQFSKMSGLTSGVVFGECHEPRLQDMIDDVKVSNFSLPDLKANKTASGRPKDVEDWRQLPEVD